MNSLFPLILMVVGAALNADKLKAILGSTQNVAVQTEVNEISKLIVLEFVSGSQLPTAENFAQFLHTNMALQKTKEAEGRDTSKDIFGTPYRLEYFEGKVRITSAGIDVTFETTDDVYAERALR